MDNSGEVIEEEEILVGLEASMVVECPVMEEPKVAEEVMAVVTAMEQILSFRYHRKSLLVTKAVVKEEDEKEEEKVLI